MVRALLEGVAFALRQIIEAMADGGAQFDRLVASGNGLASPLWRQMLADILNRPLPGQGQTRRRAGGIWSGPDCWIGLAQ
jgi:sugar (pentulose or hexulose) kinase